MKINYEELGFKDALEFTIYHWDKFSKEDQAELLAVGIYPKHERGVKKKKKK